MKKIRWSEYFCLTPRRINVKKSRVEKKNVAEISKMRLSPKRSPLSQRGFCTSFSNTHNENSRGTSLVFHQSITDIMLDVSVLLWERKPFTFFDIHFCLLRNDVLDIMYMYHSVRRRLVYSERFLVIFHVSRAHLYGNPTYFCRQTVQLCYV